MTPKASSRSGATYRAAAGDKPAGLGIAVEGDPAVIDPLGDWRFTFAVPTLNQDAQLAFTIGVAALDGATWAPFPESS